MSAWPLTVCFSGRAGPGLRADLLLSSESAGLEPSSEHSRGGLSFSQAFFLLLVLSSHPVYHWVATWKTAGGLYMWANVKTRVLRGLGTGGWQEGSLKGDEKTEESSLSEMCLSQLGSLPLPPWGPSHTLGLNSELHIPPRWIEAPAENPPPTPCAVLPWPRPHAR